MELCCTYIETDKFEEVVKFYEQILQIKPNIYTKDRWVEFNIGNKLAIYNINYDIKQLQDKNNKNVKYNQVYIENFNTKQKKTINNVITLNFYTEDLNKEYERIKNLNICKVSEIMYVNITEPYYYFNIYDPEGNTLEICGDCIEKCKNNIIITSAGFNTINNYVSEENIKLFQEKSKDKNVIIISNAAPEGTGNYVARQNVKENFLKVGAKQVDIIDITDENIDIIQKYDVIYMLGGNTTHLIELCKNDKFKENILKVLENGTYIGESAGAIILSDNIKYYYDIKKGTKPKYDVNLDSYKGLGLVNRYIYPHFQKANDEMKMKISEYEKEHKIEVTRMCDGDIIFY